MMVKALASWVLPAGALVNHGGCESSPGEHRHHFWFQEGPLSNPFSNTFPLHGGPKLDPQQIESGASKPTHAPSSAALFM